MQKVCISVAIVFLLAVGPAKADAYQDQAWSINQTDSERTTSDLKDRLYEDELSANTNRALSDMEHDRETMQREQEEDSARSRAYERGYNDGLDDGH